MKDAHVQLANRWIRINELDASFAKLLGEFKGSNLFGYVYIDHTAGITLDVIKLFNVVEDEIVFQKSPVDENTRIICRFDDFINAGEITILTDKGVAKHSLQLPNDIMSVYAKSHLEAFRTSETFHQFRAEGFPDDIQVLLPPIGDLKPELIWVRVENYENSILTCQLLNKPHQNFGIGLNDTFTASPQAVGDDYYIVGHISPQQASTQTAKKWWKFW
ncbi:hypothetical protein H2O64_02435 [Kordia sp. YSTF-M3]|uniref:Uncharacterized protein n=1 Tax=Kordia aestuariivivens TaxID=2759037 RepID=A0ABR7Q4M6_9FLAO|nr:hypothetical protein [Kordia aestuariivivens]MBC8753511.1 hypothetical protein [Kordia aestuariivivens]